jgi:hypothetical protein
MDFSCTPKKLYRPVFYVQTQLTAQDGLQRGADDFPTPTLEYRGALIAHDQTQ